MGLQERLTVNTAERSGGPAALGGHPKDISANRRRTSPIEPRIGLGRHPLTCQMQSDHF